MRYVLQSTGADVLMVEVDGDVTVYNPDTERTVPLTPMASDVLALCDGTMDRVEISRLLTTVFAERPEEAAGDVDNAIHLLLTESLIMQVQLTEPGA